MQEGRETSGIRNLDDELVRLASDLLDWDTDKYGPLAPIREREQAKLRRRRVTVGVLVGSLVLILGGAVLWRSLVAARERRTAESRRLASAAISQLASDPEQSLRLAIRSAEVSPSEEARNALRKALLASHVRAVMRGHKDKVLSAAFSPDAKTLVTASHDGTAKIWEAASGRMLAELRGHDGYVFNVAYSPDGKLIVTAGEDKTARVWDGQTGQILSVVRSHTSNVWKASFGPDNTTVATAGEDTAASVYACKACGDIEDLLPVARQRVLGD
jgi:WD40 repeat protein